jgi:diguanylate cyclase (GGDEF)-like protein
MTPYNLTGATVARAAGFALAYLAAAALGIFLTREAGNVAVFWPANGLLLGALLRLPRGDHPIILATCGLACMAANLLHGDPLGLAGGLAALNMLEVWCGYQLIARLAGPPFVLADLHKLFVLFAASLTAPAVGATAAAAVLGPAIGGAPATLWWSWWTADAIGMLLCLPLLTSFDIRPLQRLVFGPRDRGLVLAAGELVVAFSLLFVVVGLIVNGDSHGSPTLFTPILLWLALRLGIGPTATAAAMIGAVSVLASARGHWPQLMPDATLAETILSLQLRVILVALPPLVVAVVVAERARARRRLDDALESMADAFALYDTDDRLVLCNRRYPEFLGRIADLLVPGVRYADLVREGARRGMYPAVDAAQTEAWVAEQVAAHQAGGGSELQLDDGRWLHTIAQRTADGGTVDVRRDITARKLLEEAIEHMAMHDPLTDLPNRAMFYRELERMQAQARRDARGMAVMLLDLDRFKEVNDTYGHAVGDLLLVEIARRLAGCVRAGDLVARLGGDEFAVIAGSRSRADGFDGLARRIVDRLSESVELGGAEVEPAASLGMTVFPADPGGPDELVANADRALYAAKQAGRRTWALFEEGMRESESAGSQDAGDLDGALEQSEFDLDYQPIIAVGSFEVVGFEALLRWNHPRRGRLPASGFIAAAERTPMILPLTQFVLRTALRQQRTWRDGGVADLPMWVNLAPRCLRWDGLTDAVGHELAAADVRPDRLVLEVTEGSIVDLERAEGRIHALRRLGVSLALDDFGTSYSSLGRLRALRMDVVKIDRTFISGLVRNERDRAVVRTMVALGENLGLTPTAEGVETSEQLRVLRNLGCIWAQGYLFAPPMPAQDMAVWLAAWRKRDRLDSQDDLLQREADSGLPA